MTERQLGIVVKAQGADRAARDIGKVDKGIRGLTTRSIALGAGIGVGIERLAEKGIGFLASQVSQGEAALIQLQDVTAQTGAVIASTGGKAGQTAAQVRALAQAQEDLTTVDDKVVQSGENMLLTFTNIGKDVFPSATKAMVDMAVAMNGGSTEGIDLKTTAIQLGKALNDPVKGVGALRRVGVQLSAAQQKQITTLMSLTKDEQKHYLALRKTNKAAAEKYKTDQIGTRIGKAQKIILGELTTEFGKSGEAAGKGGAAGVRRLADAVEDSQIALATGLSPALDRIRAKIAETLTKPSTQQAIRDLGTFLGDAAEKGLAFAEGIPWGQVAEALKTAAGFAGGLVKVFTGMPPEVQATILGLAGLNKLSGGAVGSLVGELGKGLIKGVLGMTAGVVNINAGVVNGGGGLPGAAGAAAGAVGLGAGFISGTLLPLLAAGAVVTAVGMLAARVAYDADPTRWRDPTKSWVDQTPLRPTDRKGNPIAPRDDPSRKIIDVMDRTNDKIDAQKAKFDTLRDKMEGNRIATQTGARNIVSAINGINLNISVPITVNNKFGTLTKQVGTTLVRIGGGHTLDYLNKNFL